MQLSLKPLALVASLLFTTSAYSGIDCISENWLTKSDKSFAEDCAAMAFDQNIEDRQTFAWMIFARVNQLIKDPDNGGVSGSNKVPVWMAWPTDPETFGTTTPFVFAKTPRSELMPSVEKKDIMAGHLTTAFPDDANEEVTRNSISYNYLTENGLTTKDGVALFFAANKYVDMPVGSIELKSSWLRVTTGSPAPDGALTFRFDSGLYWWRGLHIMAKMRTLPDQTDAFYTEDSSWFWTTFEFNNGNGVAHVRDTLTTQRYPLDKAKIATILATGNVGGFGFEAYSPNGTQIGFTVGGTGKVPVILGSTTMEASAGSPNMAQPQYWKQFESSCHSCHSTASYNPETKEFFPMSFPIGALHPGYNKKNNAEVTKYLGNGYQTLDFMWPIVFNAK